MGHRTICHAQAIEHHITAVGAQQAGDEIERGGFAGAIGAEETDNFTGLKGEAHVTHQGATPEGDGDPIEGQAHGSNGLGACPLAWRSLRRLVTWRPACGSATIRSLSSR